MAQVDVTQLKALLKSKGFPVSDGPTLSGKDKSLYLDYAQRFEGVCPVRALMGLAYPEGFLANLPEAGGEDGGDAGDAGAQAQAQTFSALTAGDSTEGIPSDETTAEDQTVGDSQISTETTEQTGIDTAEGEQSSTQEVTEQPTGEQEQA